MFVGCFLAGINTKVNKHHIIEELQQRKSIPLYPRFNIMHSFGERIVYSLIGNRGLDNGKSHRHENCAMNTEAEESVKKPKLSHGTPIPTPTKSPLTSKKLIFFKGITCNHQNSRWCLDQSITIKHREHDKKAAGRSPIRKKLGTNSRMGAVQQNFQLTCCIFQKTKWNLHNPSISIWSLVYDRRSKDEQILRGMDARFTSRQRRRR